MIELKDAVNKQAIEATLCPSQGNSQGRGMCLWLIVGDGSFEYLFRWLAASFLQSESMFSALPFIDNCGETLLRFCKYPVSSTCVLSLLFAIIITVPSLQQP